ncbi:MAG: RbsD/FucU family protein [Acetivibrionales bacterium]|jgi:L-fucose mutarotase
MLKGILGILSPDLLKVLYEMGHGDEIVLTDAYFPAASYSASAGSVLVRMDGVGGTALLEAILTLFPLDRAVEKPVKLIGVREIDKDMDTSVRDKFPEIIAKYDKRGEAVVEELETYQFLERAKKAYAIVATGETSPYACIILRKDGKWD